MVKVKPAVRPTETYTEPNFVRLHTYARPRGNSGRLVTIEHLCYRPRVAGDAKSAGRSGWHCETIVDGEEMSKEDALFIAKSYAAENNVPVIYECHSE